MYFVDSEHKKFYEANYDEGLGRGMLAALYIIGSLDSVRQAGIITNVRWNDDAADGMWSGGEAIIVDLAYHFFTCGGEVNIAGACRRLDISRRRALVQAIEILAGGGSNGV